MHVQWWWHVYSVYSSLGFPMFWIIHKFCDLPFQGQVLTNLVYENARGRIFACELLFKIGIESPSSVYDGLRRLNASIISALKPLYTSFWKAIHYIYNFDAIYWGEFENQTVNRGHKPCRAIWSWLVVSGVRRDPGFCKLCESSATGAICASSERSSVSAFIFADKSYEMDRSKTEKCKSSFGSWEVHRNFFICTFSPPCPLVSWLTMSNKSFSRTRTYHPQLSFSASSSLMQQSHLIPKGWHGLCCVVWLFVGTPCETVADFVLFVSTFVLQSVTNEIESPLKDRVVFRSLECACQTAVKRNQDPLSLVWQSCQCQKCTRTQRWWDSSHTTLKLTP